MVQYASFNVCDCLLLIRHYLISHQWQNINSHYVAISVNGELVWGRKCRTVIKWATRGDKLQPDVMVTYRIYHTNDGSLFTWSVHPALLLRKQDSLGRSNSVLGHLMDLEFAPEPFQGFWQSLQIRDMWGKDRWVFLRRGDKREQGGEVRRGITV